MEITTETLENRQLRLTIEVDEERTQQAMQKAARQISKQVRIPGFRKGKAPYELIVQRFGEDTVRKEAADLLIEAVYREALEQQEIDPYAPAALDDMALNPLTFKFTISLSPTVELGDYRDYRLKPRKVKVLKKEVQEALEEIREQNAILELVERPAALEDGVVIDVTGQTADGAEFLHLDDVRILLDAESTDPAPGFTEAIVGMQANEERTFTLTLPEEFPREDLRNQEAEFTVVVKEVYDSTLPDLDDDLARTVGNFETIKELEKDVKERLHQAAQDEADQEYTEQTVEAIIEQAQVEYPPVIMEETLDDIVQEIEQAVKRETRLELENYLRFQGKTMEELRSEWEPRAAARIKRGLVLREIIRQEGLEVDQEEISTHIGEVSARWGEQAGEVRASLSSDAGSRAIRNQLLVEKAIQRLVAIARGEAPELGAAEEQESETADTGQESASEGQEAESKEQEAGSEEVGE